MDTPSTPSPTPAHELPPRLSPWAAALLGALFALGVSQLWQAETRWFVVGIVAIALAALAMATAGRYAQWLLPALMFCIPLSSLERWFFFDVVSDDQYGNVVYSGALGLGPVDLAIAGLALSWLVRTLTAPHTGRPAHGAGRAAALQPADLPVLLVLAAYLASLWGTLVPALGWFSTLYLAKHLFVYFYVSRHLDERSARWLLRAIYAAIVLEVLLALLQSQFGLLQGLARDKGAGSADRQSQYEVPGIESARRAEGTAYDSHALGLYMAMLLPLPLIRLLDDARPWKQRLWLLPLVLAALVALVLTYSRSAWLSALIMLLALAGWLLLRWRNRSVLPALAVSALPLLGLAAWAAGKIVERFSSAPAEIMTTRFEQWQVALAIWAEHPLFGVGAGNYVEALRTMNFNSALELPVHNVLLWIGAEQGLFGVLAFFSLVLLALARLLRCARRPGPLPAQLALAFAAALLAYLLDGLTNPLYREPVVFMMLWHVLAASVALPRLLDAQAPAPPETPR